MVGTRLLLEGRRAVLEQLLLPAVENRGLQNRFTAELRDWLLLNQMPPQDGDLLFRSLVLPLLLHPFSPLPYWENAFSISNGTGTIAAQPVSLGFGLANG